MWATAGWIPPGVGFALHPALGACRREKNDPDHGQPKQSFECRSQHNDDLSENEQGENDSSHLKHGSPEPVVSSSPRFCR